MKLLKKINKYACEGRLIRKGIESFDKHLCNGLCKLAMKGKRMPANKITQYACEGKLIRKGIESFDTHLCNGLRKLAMKRKKIQANKIVFMTYNNDYMCNPKYIAEEFLRRGLDYKLVWITPKTGSAPNLPNSIKGVPRGSVSSYMQMATAKFWIDNSINFFWVPIAKKKGQYLFETWHGSMGLKRIGKDDVQNKRWLEAAKYYKNNTDYCISNSEFEDEVFRTTHWPNAKILHYGHPRNDVLFLSRDSSQYLEIREKVFTYLEKIHAAVQEDDHFLLYAPTWRDDGRMDCFNIDFARLLAALREKYGGSWKVLMRLHFHDRKKHFEVDESLKDVVIPVTGYPDMQELMVVSDAGISDYSSWACDFVLTRRPMFIYATDLQKYNTERGLYYKLETTPFPIATNNDELVKNILEFDAEKYNEGCTEFLKDKGCCEQGTAAKQVVDKIIELTAR